MLNAPPVAAWPGLLSGMICSVTFGRWIADRSASS